MGTGAAYLVDRVGVLTPKALLIDRAGAGRGRLHHRRRSRRSPTRGSATPSPTTASPPTAPLPGFRPSQPVVFCGMYPTDADDYGNLRDSLGKLRLNDASFEYEPESSSALGLGFRCGFLGLLHLEIIQERLEREFDLDIVITAPSVVYRVHQSDGQVLELHNPADYPDPTRIDHVEEPWIKATILVPDEFLGGILQLCTEKRGLQQELTYVGNRAMVVYRLPLNEVVYDFYDRLKSISRGYASFDYQLDGYGESDLVKLDVLINGDRVDSLSMIVHRSNAESKGRGICEKLKELIPRQNVPGGDPGRDRRPDRRARDGQGVPQGRARQVLRRRHHPQAQAPGEAEGRQEAHAPGGPGRDPAGGVPGRAEDGLSAGVGDDEVAARACNHARRDRLADTRRVRRLTGCSHRRAGSILEGGSGTQVGRRCAPSCTRGSSKAFSIRNRLEPVGDD